MVGARAVARAWTDPALQARCCSTTPTPALADFGLDYAMLVVVGEHAGGPQPRRLHALLLLPVAGARPAAHLVQDAGLPLARGERAARAPRASSALDVPAEREIRVWDSSAEMRYMVLPQRPAGTEGLGEAELVPLDHARRADRRGRGAAAAPAPAERERRVRAAPQHRGAPRRAAASTWRASAGQLFVCATGCCCGRTEDGFAPVPAETFHREWERRRLRNVVHLTIGGCLGPCALANVALLLFDGQAQWFHSIDSEALARRALRPRGGDAGGRRLPAAAARARAVSLHRLGLAAAARRPAGRRRAASGARAARRTPATCTPSGMTADGRARSAWTAWSRSMEGQAALPRKNGELVFDEPWQGRVFGMAVALHERGSTTGRSSARPSSPRSPAAEARPAARSSTTRSGSRPSRTCSPARASSPRAELDETTYQFEFGERDDVF